LIEALAADRRDPLDGDDRRHVLDRLIDEELLVQRALELGLARRERRLRADLTGAVIASVVAAAEDGAPEEAELRAFYDQNRGFFRRLGRVHVRQVFVRAHGADSDAALQRARELERRWKEGAEYADVAALGDAPLPPLPDAPIPVPKLRDYLGPTAARTALELAPGEISEPIRSGDGFHVLKLLERQENATPPYDEIRAQVAAEFRRRQGETALRRYLDDLRDRSEITVAEDAP
jgi:parvulin-like peptidyl-prolyl isomerase